MGDFAATFDKYTFASFQQTEQALDKYLVCFYEFLHPLQVTKISKLATFEH